MKSFLVVGALCAWIAYGQPMVRVPAGSFEVTDPITTLKTKITVSEFLLGSTEVTQRDYQEAMGANPSFQPGADHPVENVAWWDALRYANARSVREKLHPCYDLSSGAWDRSCDGYRLPTDAEWTRALGAMPAAASLSRAARLGDADTKSVERMREAITKGTAAVKSGEPNQYGLYDMLGNVWEWVYNYFDPVESPDSVRDPAGPPRGLNRMIRGGSFVSTTSSWGRGYRSSMPPVYHSRFTGFRVARSVAAAGEAAMPDDAFFRRYRNAPAGYETSIGQLSRLVEPGASLDQWQRRAAALRAKWEEWLRPPESGHGPVASRTLSRVAQGNFDGQLMELEVEPGGWEKIYILRPSAVYRRPLPVMIVPFYDVDTPAAADLGGRNFTSPASVRAFAYIAAQHGYLAVAIRWFGESYGESYSEAVANLALKHPGATGLGKWVADARRLVDFIGTLPDADAGRIGIIGHSLGGKMALYAAALEPRIAAAVSSELGTGFTMSNYEDYWYFGEALRKAAPGTDQHELIGLLAPRPFLLIGGDMYDKAESWHYINAARQVYSLYGAANRVGYFNHHTGHTPTPEAVSLAFDWLDRFLRP